MQKIMLLRIMLSSALVRRRRKRYVSFYPYKIIRGYTLNPGLQWYIHLQKGRMIKKQLFTIASSQYFWTNAAKLFNCLSKKLTVLNTTISWVKDALDKFLKQIPLPGYAQFYQLPRIELTISVKVHYVLQCILSFTSLLLKMGWSNYSLVKEMSSVTKNQLKSLTQNAELFNLKINGSMAIRLFLLSFAQFFLFIFKHLLQHNMCFTISAYDSVELLIILLL